MHHIEAAVGAFCIAGDQQLLGNRFWTFRDSAGERGASFQAVRFLTVSVLALGVELASLALLVDVFGLQAVPGQAIALATRVPQFVGT